MAKFKCPQCGKIVKYDLRLNSVKYFLTKGGKYRSSCGKAGKNVFMKRVGQNGNDA